LPATATAAYAQSATDPIFIRLTVRDDSGRILGDTLCRYNWKDYMRYESRNCLPEVRPRVRVSPKSMVAKEIGKGRDLYSSTPSSDSPARSGK